jgi:hypothetical protein
MTSAVRFAVLIGGPFAAWGLWFAEVYWVKGWAGLAWLSGFNWSSVPICALIVIMSSSILSAQAPLSARVMFLGVGFAIAITAFVIARLAVFELFSGGIPARTGPAATAALVVSGLIVSVGLPMLANRCLVPLRRWTGVLVGLALLLVLPISFVTIKVFPAFNGSTDQIHSIKMGYPVFWTAVLVPVALRLGRISTAESR